MSDFAGGTGTAHDPYLIETETQLNELRNYTSGYYFKLIADIELVSDWTMVTSAWAGTLDGNFHKITNFNCSNLSAKVGMFSINAAGYFIVKRLSIYGGSTGLVTGSSYYCGYILAEQRNNTDAYIKISDCLIYGKYNAGTDRGSGVVGITHTNFIHLNGVVAICEKVSGGRGNSLLYEYQGAADAWGSYYDETLAGSTATYANETHLTTTEFTDFDNFPDLNKAYWEHNGTHPVLKSRKAFDEDDWTDVNPIGFTLNKTYDSSFINDEFTGDDDDPPNPALWFDYETTSATNKISSNKLSMAVTSTPANEYNTVQSTFKLVGDCEVQIGYSSFSYSGSGGFELSLKDDYANSMYLKVSGVYSSNYVTFGTYHTTQTNSRTYDYGVLKIVRSGSTLTAYHKDGNGSFAQINTATVTDREITIVLAQWVPTGSTAAVLLDDLSISSDGIVELQNHWQNYPVIIYGPDYKAPDPYADDVVLAVDFAGVSGNTDFVDLSDSEHTLTTVGGAKTVVGSAPFPGTNQCLYVDGSGDYITVPDSTDFTLGSDDFTLEVLARIYETQTTDKYVCCQYAYTANKRSFAINITSGAIFRFMYSITGASSIVLSSTTALTVGQWHHLAVTRVGDTLRVFVDGVLENTATVTGSLYDSDVPFVIGSSSQYTYSFKGHISDVRLTKGVGRYTASFDTFDHPMYQVLAEDVDKNLGKSADPIFEEFNLIDPYWDDVIFACPFYGPDGTTSYIEETLKSVEFVGNAKISTTESKFEGSSLYCDGSGGYAHDTQTVYKELGEVYTIECWIYPKTFPTSNYAGIIMIGSLSSNDNRLMISFIGDGNIYCYEDNGPDSGVTSEMGVGVITVLEEWYHIAFVRDSNGYRCYLDGVLQNTDTTYDFDTQSVNTELHIGVARHASTAQYFDGYIQDVRITAGVARYTTSFDTPTFALARKIGPLDPTPQGKLCAFREKGTDYQYPFQLVDDSWITNNTMEFMLNVPVLSDKVEVELYYDIDADENTNATTSATAPTLSTNANVLFFYLEGLDNILWRIQSVGILSELSQVYDLELLKYLTSLTQDYDILTRYLEKLQQSYGDSFFNIINQPYGDYEKALSLLKQYYGNMGMLLSRLTQVYGYYYPATVSLRQTYSLSEKLIAQFEQEYNIASTIPASSVVQLYELLLRNKCVQELSQKYSAFPSSVVEEAPVIVVTKKVVVEEEDDTGGDPGIPGEDPVEISTELTILSIDYEYGLDMYCASFTVRLHSFKQWTEVEYLSKLVIQIGEVEHNLIVISKSSQESIGSRVYNIEARSRAVLLDLPYATAVPDTFVVEGTASSVVNDLADLEGMSVTWQMDSDPPLNSESVQVAGNSPLSNIRSIVNELGGRIQSRPDGSIFAVKRHKVDSDKYEDVEPVYGLTTGVDFILLNTNISKRSGANKFTIDSHVSSSTLGYQLKTDQVEPDTIEVRAYKVPWSDQAVDLLTSELDDGKLLIISEGIVVEEHEEEIEIVGGTGKVSNPCYNVQSWVYDNRIDLGEVTISEEGVVTTAEEHESIVIVKYESKCWKWTTIDSDAEKVQFILVII